MPRAWAVAFLLLAVDADADEIVRRGEVVRGTLVLNGRLELLGADGKVSASGAELGCVKLTPTGKTFRDGPAHVVTLSKDERLTGVFVGMEKETIALRTAWAERVAVPRAGVVSLTHLPGWRTLIREDFAGKPMRLTKAGQTIEVPVSAGRVGVLFEETTDSRWVVEAVFATRTVRIAFADDTLSVDSGGLRGTAYRVKGSGEARKLTLAFSGESLRIACDDEALWYSPDAGPGALRKVRIACVTDGKVMISGVIVEAAESVRRRPAGDPKRDELCWGAATSYSAT